ncbi:hypothetical protein S7711_05464 [Stachybotrys chartarum IBT 7711]|uniref:NAD-dependent epimerase/dehydratase domain-containing protein n=1 Tax=Stachybotrys chartarum (strain CBS 109288 / IBT 7711) TaxID=1280523 RepID=A0A084BAY5_STACB|nr:hypothetical protein S7711_05464 [Stachybotrys chartarum IBT 7711]
MATNPPPRSPPKAVFVTGANGYIGLAVCRAFVHAGYKVFGLIRRPEAARDLVLNEITPVVGTFADHGFLEALFHQQKTFDVVVNTTEAFPGYAAHFEQALALVRKIAEVSNANSVRPLVLWSSGCKDYGMTLRHGDNDLEPHTEESPLTTIDALAERASSCPRVFDHEGLFDAAVLRPTNVYGYSSSYYGAMLDYAASAAAAGSATLLIPNDPNNIQHALHVDDCAAAYVALAQHAPRSAVSHQAFNISSHRYETVREVAVALAREYGMTGGVRFVAAEEAPATFPGGLHMVFGWSQWVGSEKIRRLTGWDDRRALWSEDLGTYRRAYEAEMERGNDNIGVVQARMAGALQGK